MADDSVHDASSLQNIPNGPNGPNGVRMRSITTKCYLTLRLQKEDAGKAVIFKENPSLSV